MTRSKYYNEKKPSVNVVVCRELEAVLFDASITEKYEYGFFPGMCGCVGFVIQDNKQLDKKALIHYVGNTNLESVHAFILKNFPSKDISITTFSGNPPANNVFPIPEDFPAISLNAPNIKNSLVPQFDQAIFSNRNYMVRAFKNRLEVNFILQTLINETWIINHEHNNTISFRQDVFVNLKDMSLSANLDVNVIRDDFTPEDEQNILFDRNRIYRNTIYDTLCHYANGLTNIVVTDKRSWSQYTQDSMHSISMHKNTLFFAGAVGTALAATAAVLSFNKK